MKKSIIKEISYYVAAICLCFIFLYWVMHLWAADLTIPFAYSGDANIWGPLIKGMIDNGWYLSNSFIGMPSGLFYYDMPLNCNLDFSIMKMISFIFPNWAATLNIYFLLTFPLTVITTLFVLRKINISALSAIAGSLLFAFIPYHFFRGEGHLNMTAYFLIPLIVLVIFWIYEDELLLNQFKKSSNHSLLPLLNWKNLFSIIICVGIASTFIYYSFFSCFFLLVGGMCAAISRKRWTPLFNSFILIGIIVLFIVISNIPSLIYWFENGRNTAAAIRPPGDTDFYGLRIIQLLLPVPGHHIPLFSYIADTYARTSPLITENRMATLGFIGSVGFIILIAWIFYRMFDRFSNTRNDTFNKLTQLSALNLSAVLLATIGGFGTIFAYIVLPQIRAYNRISIFIAFFAILAIVLLLDLLIKRYAFSRFKKWGLYGLAVVILFTGIFDQTSPIFIPDYAGVKKQFTSDGKFVNNIETTCPADNMVFQLPYVPYPENPPVSRMTDYDHFRAYLHSTNIHWSYGAMKGRDGDLWQRNITSKPIDEMIEGLSLAGFNGIYVDSYGYNDNGKEVISNLTSILQVIPLASDDDRLYFFDMTPYNNNLKAQYTPQELEKKKDSVLNYLRTEWRDSFSFLEGTAENNWRWCAAQGTLTINNPSAKEKKVDFKANFVTGYPESANLKIESTLLNENLKINNAGSDFEKEIIIPPGRHVIKFSCDAKRLDAPGDPRFIVFGTRNFQLIESE